VISSSARLAWTTLAVAAAIAGACLGDEVRAQQSPTPVPASSGSDLEELVRPLAPRPVRELIGAGGVPLPFGDDDEIEAFLADAEVLSIEEIPVGVTRPKKVELELGGVRAAGAWRTVDISKRQERLRDGTVINNFRDSYRGEIAAYRLARLLGIDAVPPVVFRRIRGEDGSLQLWIETAMTQRQRVRRGVQPPDRIAYKQQLRTMTLFDNLIANLDRNQGNSLIDHHWKVWFIDHTRAFFRGRKLHAPDEVVWVERGVWRRLREVSDGEIRAALEDAIGKHEINALLERRRRLVELVRQRIGSEGEERVVFEYVDAAPTGG
jgi:hypothetical protein